MGVADNKSYKNQYHFGKGTTFRIDGEDFPSINDEKKINTTIKENPYMSNVEIEGKEVVLQPDLSALFKAVGKRHSKGGMDVLLKPESFIFSDDKTLALDETDYDTFELKKGGSFKPYSNTPAAALKKNIDIKHYNTLISNLDDVNKDDLAKKSSAMMLQKYIETLGNIAYIQENKKGFPQGLPTFSMGTAPVYDGELKSEIEENKQYMKYGGNVTMQRGGLNEQGTRRISELKNKGRISQQEARELELLQQTNDRLLQESQQRILNPFGQQPVSQYLPGPFNSTKPQEWDWKNPFRLPSKVPQQGYPTTSPTNEGVSLPPSTKPLKKGEKPVVTDWGLWQGDKMSDFVNRYGVSNRADKINDLDYLSKTLGYTGPKNNAAFQKWLYNSSPENKAIIDKWHEEYGNGPIGGKPSEGKFDNKIGIRWQNAIRQIMAGSPTTIPKTPQTTGEECPCGMGRLGNCLPCDDLTKAPVVEPVPGTVTPDGQNPLDPNWQFTPWQKVSHLYNWLNYANVKRYMPTRSQLDPDYADPALLNEQQAVSDSRGVMNQQVAGLRSTSPILAGAQQNSLFGQYLDKLPEVKVAVQNANAQTKNQFRLDNKQTSNTAKIFNINADQTYYRESVEGRKNFDNLRNFAANNAMSNIMDDVTSNQELAYRMMTVRDPAYILDWRTGKFKPNPNRSIMNQQGSSSASTMDAMLQYIKDLKAAGIEPSDRAALLKTKVFSETAPYLGQPSFGQIRGLKKGGRVKSRYSK